VEIGLTLVHVQVTFALEDERVYFPSFLTEVYIEILIE
jgi:hypothetical protein